jgi:hypothetical protein
VLRKTVSSLEVEKDVFAKSVMDMIVHAKKKDEEVFWLINQGIPGAVDLFQNSFEYVESLDKFNPYAEFAGRVEGFNDGLQYSMEGKPRDSYPYLDLEVFEKKKAAQTHFEKLPVPLLQTVA